MRTHFGSEHPWHCSFGGAVLVCSGPGEGPVVQQGHEPGPGRRQRCDALSCTTQLIDSIVWEHAHPCHSVNNERVWHRAEEFQELFEEHTSEFGVLTWPLHSPLIGGSHNGPPQDSSSLFSFQHDDIKLSRLLKMLIYKTEKQKRILWMNRDLNKWKV